MGDKNLKLKVLGREFEGDIFFKRVSLNIMCKSFCMSIAPTSNLHKITQPIVTALFL